MIKLDLHVHSHYSEDAIGSPKDIIKSLVKKGVKGAAFTDHNTIKGGVKAKKIAPKGFIVIVGTEISSSDGHVLALNINENIDRGLCVEETIEKIIDAGGTPIIPHLYRMMSGIKMKKLYKIYKKISAIEVFNGCSMPKSNMKSAKISRKLNLGGIGGSDTHDYKYAGLGYTIIDINDIIGDIVIEEINNKKTWGEGITMPLSYRQDRMLKSINQFFQRGLRRI